MRCITQSVLSKCLATFPAKTQVRCKSRGSLFWVKTAETYRFHKGCTYSHLYQRWMWSPKLLHTTKKKEEESISSDFHDKIHEYRKKRTVSQTHRDRYNQYI